MRVFTEQFQLALNNGLSAFRGLKMKVITVNAFIGTRRIRPYLQVYIWKLCVTHCRPARRCVCVQGEGELSLYLNAMLLCILGWVEINIKSFLSWHQSKVWSALLVHHLNYQRSPMAVFELESGWTSSGCNEVPKNKCRCSWSSSSQLLTLVTSLPRSSLPLPHNLQAVSLYECIICERPINSTRTLRRMQYYVEPKATALGEIQVRNKQNPRRDHCHA